MTTTISRILLNSTRADAALVLKWAHIAAENGGSFSVKNEWVDSNWYSTITINWPSEAMRATAQDARKE